MTASFAHPDRCDMLPPGTVVLFLDYDGVLQTPALQDWREMEHAPALEELLAGHPELMLVVSATQLETDAPESVVALLPEPLRLRVVGTLPVSATGRADGGRAALIAQWLAAHPEVKRWVAVDDEARLYEPECPWLVQTHKWVGWDEFTTQQVQALLSGQEPLARTRTSLGGYPRQHVQAPASQSEPDQAAAPRATADPVPAKPGLLERMAGWVRDARR